MPEIPVSSIEVRLQKLAAQARIALEQGSLDYALATCGRILRTAPGCLEVRRLQRVAQLRRWRERNRFVAKLRGAAAEVRALLAGGARQDPARMFADAEAVLSTDPVSVPALKRLAAAALALDLPETAVFAGEAVRELRPDDRDNLLRLGEAWLAARRPEEALRLAEALLRTQPSDPEAQALMRQASIAQTVARGKWEAPTTFRDKLKDGA
jgi:hypothetical protein